MILSIMYMYYARSGQIEFNPWWLGAAAFCDMVIISSIGNAISNSGALFNFSVE